METETRADTEPVETETRADTEIDGDIDKGRNRN